MKNDNGTFSPPEFITSPAHRTPDKQILIQRRLENEQARKAHYCEWRTKREAKKTPSRRKLATKSCKRGKNIDLLKRQDIFIKRSAPPSDDETPDEQKLKTTYHH
ncbi:unnamed protein product [Rhizophagus irregularis]|nr:unnamed protein product [Rhizophagus irregularis]